MAEVDTEVLRVPGSCVLRRPPVLCRDQSTGKLVFGHCRIASEYDGEDVASPSIPDCGEDRIPLSLFGLGVAHRHLLFRPPRQMVFLRTVILKSETTCRRDEREGRSCDAGLLAPSTVRLRMDRPEFAARIDHTVLGPTTAWADVERVLEEAADYGTNACVPPCYVAEAATEEPNVTLATVVGFPHGQHATAAKRAEAVGAVEDGADELDVVLNVGRLKAGAEDAATEELSAIVSAVSVPVKVIIETPLLSDAEKRRACETAVAAGADFVKTATGFSDGGATVADVRLMSEYLPVKASGGVRTAEDALELLAAGASRIGASRGAAIVEGFSAAVERGSAGE